MAPKQVDNWNRYQKLILYRLDKQDESIAEIKKAAMETNRAITGLKITVAGVASGVSSIVTLAVAFVINWARGK